MGPIRELKEKAELRVRGLRKAVFITQLQRLFLAVDLAFTFFQRSLPRAEILPMHKVDYDCIE